MLCSDYTVDLAYNRFGFSLWWLDAKHIPSKLLCNNYSQPVQTFCLCKCAIPCPYNQRFSGDLDSNLPISKKFK